MKKLQNRRGETLVETLCAVLVVGLAVALLAAMVSASSRLDRKAGQEAGALYGAVSDAEATEGTSADGNVTVIIGEAEGQPGVEVPVTFYGDQDQAVSYRPKTGGGSTP